jgi:uncharacterized membrane protein YcaP (DUF421 family)
MEKLFAVDFEALIIPTHSVLEMIVRGTVMYLMLVAIVRLLRRRGIGTLGVADLLVIVIIADAAQNALSNEYQSLTEGIVLILTIVGWDYVLDLLSYRFPKVRRLLHWPALMLVLDGKIIRGNMEKESLTDQELMSHLRVKGIDDLRQVKKAFLEDNGQVSVIKVRGGETEESGGDHSRATT